MLLSTFSRCFAIALLATVVPVSAHAQPVVGLLGITTFGTPTGPSGVLVDIDQSSGTATNPRNTGVTVFAGIAYAQNTGILYGLTTSPSSLPNSLVQIDRATGVTSIIGHTGLSNIIEGDLAYNPSDGLLYGVQDVPTSNARTLFRVSAQTGQASPIGNLPINLTQGDYSGLAFSATGQLYTIETTHNAALLHRLDTNTAAIENTVTLQSGFGTALGMAFDPTSGELYVANGGVPDIVRNLYRVDVTSGLVTTVGPLGIAGGVSGITFVSVPEPSAVICMTTALLLTAAKVRRNRTRQRLAVEPT